MPPVLKTPFIASSSYTLENQSLRSVGEYLGLTEDAAQKRVTRALLERLRKKLTRCGIVLSATVIASTVASEATAGAIPPGLAASLMKTALATPPPSPFAAITAITARKLVAGIAAATLAFSLWLTSNPKAEKPQQPQPIIPSVHGSPSLLRPPFPFRNLVPIQFRHRSCPHSGLHPYKAGRAHFAIPSGSPQKYS